MSHDDLKFQPPDKLAAQVQQALAEDVGSGDRTAALVPPEQQAQASIVAREAGVLCGEPWVAEVCRQVEPAIRCQWRAAEGEQVDADSVVCDLSGPARGLLTAERTALNFLQCLSGTATLTRQYVDAVAGTKAVILDTRKTVPGLRLAQKYAVRCGGGRNHRLGLYDAVLIKENHITAAGSIAAAVAAAPHTEMLVEIEVENLDQLDEALDTPAARILLDNFSAAELRQGVHRRDRLAPQIALEASGGITLANIRAVAETGVDFISIGALTKDIRALDLSMRFRFAG